MKWLTRFIIFTLILVLLFFAFYKPKKINLEGNWETKKIILNGKKIYPDTLSKFIFIPPNIVINNWSKSISIPLNQKKIKVHLEYLESKNSNSKVRLYSKEKLLNGIFDVKIDTFNIQPKSFTVAVELKSHKTFISFQKKVIISEWKPSRHRKGTPY